MDNASVLKFKKIIIDPACKHGPISDILCFDSMIYLVDEYNHCIYVLSEEKRVLSAIGKKGSGHGEFLYPKGIAVDRAGFLYVADSWNHRIQKISPDGRVAACFGNYGDKAGELNEPYGIAVDSDSMIYVVERSNHRIQVFNQSCKSEGIIGGRGTLQEEDLAELMNYDEILFCRHAFEFPTQIIIRDKMLYIVDSGNHRIQIYRRDGRHIGSFGRRGEYMGHFQYPHSIAFGACNSLIITDCNNKRVQVLTEHGEPVAMFSPLEYPRAVCADGKNNIYVSSYYTDTLFKTAVNETLLRKIKTEDKNAACADLSVSMQDIEGYKKKGIEGIIGAIDSEIRQHESELFSLKDRLISLIEKDADVYIVIEQDILQSRDVDTELEREGIGISEQIEETFKSIEQAHLLYKRAVKKKYDAVDIHARHSKKDNDANMAVAETIISQFAISIEYISCLLLEKEMYEAEAERYFNNHEGSDDENWRGFKITTNRAYAIRRFLDLFLSVSRHIVNMMSVACKLVSEDKLKTILSETGGKRKALPQQLGTVVRLFNSDWYAVTTHLEKRIEPDINITGELIALSHVMPFSSLLINLYDKKDIDPLNDTYLKDINNNILARFLLYAFLMGDKGIREAVLRTAAKQGFELLSRRGVIVNSAADQISSLMDALSMRYNDIKTVVHEISKSECIMESGVIEHKKGILLTRRHSLLTFHFGMLKRDVTALFQKMTVSYYQLEILYLALLSAFPEDKSLYESIEEEKDKYRADLLSTIEDYGDKIACMLNELSEITERKKGEDEKLIAQCEYEIKVRNLLLEYMNFCISFYEDIYSLTAFFNDKSIHGKIAHKNSGALNVMLNRVIINPASTERNIRNPAGIACSDDGHIYVAEAGNHCIKKLTYEGEFVCNIGYFGSLPGCFRAAASVLIGADGYIYASDSNNNRIQKFSPDGKFILSFGSEGTADGHLLLPRGMAQDRDGYIYVADYGNNRIQKFDVDGNHIFTFGRPGSERGEMKGPTGLAILEDCTILVSEQHNNRIQLFDSTGKSMRILGSKGFMEGEFNWPAFITQGGDGTIYVAEFLNCRIQMFDNSLTYKGQIGRHDGYYYPFRSIFSVAVSSGYLYIPDYVSGCIYRYAIS